MVEQRLPCREPGEGHGGRANMIEGPGLGCQVGRSGCHELGRCTVAPKVQQPIDGIGPSHVGCSIANSLHEDRKSTRLNSSHLVISYAVFCLKKKKNK